MFGVEPLMPAMGRDYKDIKDLQKDFDDNKDFKTAMGQYINKEQLKAMNVARVRVRFNKLGESDFVQVT